MSNDSSSSSHAVRAAVSGTSKARWPRGIVASVLTPLLFIIGQIVGSMLVYGLLLLTGEAAGVTTLVGSEILLQFTALVLSYLSMLAGLWWLLRHWSIAFKQLGLVWPPRFKDVGLSLLGFGCYIAVYLTVVFFVLPFIPGVDVNQRQDVGFSGAAGWSLLMVALSFVLVAPVVEELLMRGFLFTALRRRSSFWVAAIVVSMLFATLHLGGGQAGSGPLWIAAVDTGILSIVLCYLRERTGRLWASIGLHMIKNGLAFLALFVLTDFQYGSGNVVNELLPIVQKAMFLWT